VKPSDVDPIFFKQLELMILQMAKDDHFVCLQLSPLAPFGSCSGVALADQNKIVSALRGTEVVSDATNVLAVHAISQRQHHQIRADINLCAVHRHVRAQSFSGKGFTAHFGAFCAVTSGLDRGNRTFEAESLQRHLSLYLRCLNTQGLVAKVELKVLDGETAGMYMELGREVARRLTHTDITVIEVDRALHRYYTRLRFSINVMWQGQEYNIGDGGFVDWGAKLSGNKKERMLTSGIGTEFLYKLTQGRI
jgi:hypothetical protein